ncbi:MAG: TonB-dependent receptor, partial [Bacteroidales bacterium]
ALVNNIGILGLAKVVVSNTTTLQGGLRFDVYNTETDALSTEGTSSYIAPLVRNYSNLNGSFGITYRPEERLMLRMNIAKGYRVPNLSELTSSGMHGNRFEQGNADLSPENSIQTDLSLHYHGELLSFDLAGYYNHLTNYIHISPSADTTASGLTIYRFSQTNARLYGGEAGIHFHPRSLPWMHFEANFSSVIGKQENGDYLSFIPAHKMRYEIRADRQKMAFLLKPTIKVSALTAFSQKHPSPYETETGGYTIVNLNLGAGVLVFKQRLEIGLAINNLFDTKYYDHLSTLKGLYYNPGRNINVSLKLPFEIG